MAQAQKLVALNGETWGMMTTPSYRGKVRLGVPLDIVAHYTPPILRRFNTAWPHVRVSLQPGNSKDLLEELDRAKIDLTLTTDLESQRACEALRRDRLVWVGCDHASAHSQRPLSLSIGGKSCRFRPVVMSAMTAIHLDCRNSTSTYICPGPVRANWVANWHTIFVPSLPRDLVKASHGRERRVADVERPRAD
ncbi:MAG: LysR family transcriptional regulator substrate-binding protein [Hyphomicrobiaceae bacterium]